jgi:hypothetical protein
MKAGCRDPNPNPTYTHTSHPCHRDDVLGLGVGGGKGGDVSTVTSRLQEQRGFCLLSCCRFSFTGRTLSF